MAKPRVVLALDAGALVQAEKSNKVGAVIRKWLKEDAQIVIPAPCLAEALRSNARDARANQLVNTAKGVIVETTERIARSAGHLLATTGGSNTIDALVVATAHSCNCTDILTSDPDDIRLLDKSMKVHKI